MGRTGVRILVLSFYYRPDLCAGSFRTTALVAALRDRIPAGSSVDVLTTLPNRYRSFSAEAPAFEEKQGISVRRFAVGRHESGMADQSVAFAAFARQVWAAVAARAYDVVFATSSRLMTAVLGAWVARRTGARLYLDIRDIFADNVMELLAGPAARVARALSRALERFALARADRVNLVSPGFLGYFQARYPHHRFSCITNGIDDEFLRAGPTQRRPSPRAERPGILSVVYAGNIGEGQGLHRIIPPLGRVLEGRVRFTIIGDGGRRRALETAVAAAGVDNVVVLPPVGRDQLIAAYQASDILFLHLNDYVAFESVLPSKVFEYAAMGKPLWAGAAGCTAEFIASEITNASVFRPCDVEGAVRALAQLTMEDAPRPEFIAKYGRAALSERLADDVLSIVASKPDHHG
jgi:glycosyltransferase involved in cell wall biosynthesis